MVKLSWIRVFWARDSAVNFVQVLETEKQAVFLRSAVWLRPTSMYMKCNADGSYQGSMKELLVWSCEIELQVSCWPGQSSPSTH